MCLVLLLTSLAQHSHTYGMDSEIPELHCHLHTVFCIGHNFETIISGEMIGTLLSSSWLLNMKRLVTLKYKQRKTSKSNFRKQLGSLVLMSLNSTDKEEALEYQC